MSLFAIMTCCWCGHPRRCQLLRDVGWCCRSCWEEAEGVQAQEAA